MKEIKKVTVMGAGTMGPGIAEILTIAGCEVCLYDIVPAALEKAKDALHKNLEVFVEEKLLKEEQVEPLFHKVTYSSELKGAMDGVDLVVEAIVEKKEIKTSVYQQLDEILPMGTIIASNTSALNIFEIMPERRLPDTVIAHWYAPANVIPLVEVVGNEQTRPEVIETVMALLKKGGKTPVHMKKFIRGYIVNRLQQCLNQEVFYLLEHGYCTAEDIDLAVKNSFIPRAMVLGLCKRMDFGGVDMTANNFRNHSYEMPHPPADEPVPHILEDMVAHNELGIKTGKGFYDYSDVDMEEELAKRDKQLFDAFRLEKKFLDDPV